MTFSGHDDSIINIVLGLLLLLLSPLAAIKSRTDTFWYRLIQVHLQMAVKTERERQNSEVKHEKQLVPGEPAESCWSCGRLCEVNEVPRFDWRSSSLAISSSTVRNSSCWHKHTHIGNSINYTFTVSASIWMLILNGKGRPITACRVATFQSASNSQLLQVLQVTST